MARSWKPTEKQMSAYEDILKKYQKLRKQIIKAHRNLEQITPSGRMPAMVVPQRERKLTMKQIRVSGRRMFNLKIRQLKKIVHGGLQAFYADYKKSYLQLYRDYIIEDLPEGYQNRFYSDLQIKEMEAENPQMAQFMRDYNSLVNMNGTVFTLLIKTGKMPEFKYIYRQFQNDFDMYENYAQEFHKGLKFARRIDVKDAERILGGANFSKRSKDTMDLYKKAWEIEQIKKGK